MDSERASSAIRTQGYTDGCLPRPQHIHFAQGHIDKGSTKQTCPSVGARASSAKMLVHLLCCGEGGRALANSAAPDQQARELQKQSTFIAQVFAMLPPPLTSPSLRIWDSKPSPSVEGRTSWQPSF